MALPEITVEDLENISDNATDNRQRLQKSLIRHLEQLKMFKNRLFL